MKIFKNDQILTLFQILLALLGLRYISWVHLEEYIGMDHKNFAFSILGIATIIYAGFYLYKIVLQEEYPSKNIIKNIEKAYYYYIGLNALGVIISFFVAESLQKTYYFGFYLVIVATMYLYVTQWRKIILFDNIVLAFIITYPIFLQSCFDLLPTLEFRVHEPKVSFILDFALIWFVLLWILFFLRSILHDLIFVQVDIRRGKKTLATKKGREVGAIRTGYLAILPLVIMFYLTYIYFEAQIFVVFSSIFMIIPSLYLITKIRSSRVAEDFIKAKNILNAIIWFSIISIVTLSINLS